MSNDRSQAMDHVVLAMFENRSFDNLLGRLYRPEERCGAVLSAPGLGHLEGCFGLGSWITVMRRWSLTVPW